MITIYSPPLTQRKEAQLAKFLESKKVGPTTPMAGGSSPSSTSIGSPTRLEPDGTDPSATKDLPVDELDSGPGPVAQGDKDKIDQDGRKDEGS